MRRLAVLSFHTSPLAQPGTGDSGGMNVYVRELSTALARAGVVCDVYTRNDGVGGTVKVEPGFEVHYIDAGPAGPVPKEHLHELLDQFTEGVLAHMIEPPSAVHANYWLSGIAGHAIKHQLDVPLVSTFHTLDRVKAVASPEEEEASEWSRRAWAEKAVIGCSDALLASCSVELDQLVDLYGADADRISIVPLGVDHAFFSPGDRRAAQRAIGLDNRSGPLLLFIGRIQPLKGADVAVRALAELKDLEARLLIVGGPSGPHGQAEVESLHDLVDQLGLVDNVTFAAPQPHELLSSYYRAADCCIVPSRSESFGLVALEAAACGTPVVAAAVGGLTTLVQDGRTGYLVEPDDPEGFAKRVASIVTNPIHQADLGAGGAEMAKSYTWATAGQRLRELYADLTSRELIEC